MIQCCSFLKHFYSAPIVLFYVRIYEVNLEGALGGKAALLRGTMFSSLSIAEHLACPRNEVLGLVERKHSLVVGKSNRRSFRVGAVKNIG